MAFLREIRAVRKSGKIYSYWVVMKSFWDKKEKKARHRIIHNLGTLSKEEVKTIRTILSLKGMPKDSFFTSPGRILKRKRIMIIWSLCS